MSAPVLHVRGQVLTGPEEVLEEIWVIDGVVSLTAPTSGDVETVQGYAVPGLVDAHCHVGLEAHGAVEDARAEEHALAERLYGELREAGLDVIYDDREDLGPGGKFADAELLGCPLRLTAGKRSLASGELEAQVRRGQQSRTLPLEGAAEAAAELWRTLA